VTVGGQSLVVGSQPGPPPVAASLNTIYADTSATDPGQMISVGATSATATAVTMGGGSVAASVTTLTDTLPDVQSQLDKVASTLADKVNTTQSNGYDQNGAAGTDMFGGGPPVTAANIKVTLTDGAKVAASATAPTTDPVTGDLIANNDGSNALAASATGAASDSPDALYNTLVGYVGSKSSLAQQQQTTQDAVTASVDAMRQSASGVNLDEEVTNMLTLQQSYQASSKVLATMNSMLDTLINGLGIGS
jgi:flagellar hook-associated protein 1 FlgK